MRIDEILADLQNLTKQRLTYSDIAPIFNTTGNAIRNWAYRKRELLPFEIEKIYRHFGVEQTKQDIILSDDVDKPKIKCDYFYDVFGSCGAGAFVLSECKRPIDVPIEAIHNFSKYGQYSVINAVGDSMLPYIHDKDLLIVEHTSEIKDNQIHVFCYHDTIYVKRLIKNINKLVIVSDNPNKDIYETITLQKNEVNDILVIGRVVGLMRQCR